VIDRLTGCVIGCVIDRLTGCAIDRMTG